jgi:hypothetical protein
VIREICSMGHEMNVPANPIHAASLTESRLDPLMTIIQHKPDLSWLLKKRKGKEP